MQLATTNWTDSTASVTGGKGTTYERGGYVKKRVTPEDDYRRLAERVWRRGKQDGLVIKTKADFLSVYQSYMRNAPNRNDESLRDNVFGEVQKRHPGVSSSVKTSKERVEVFYEAGAKPSAAEFNVLGKSGGRTVYARRTVVKFVKRGVVRVVFRDKKGRFVSVK